MKRNWELILIGLAAAVILCCAGLIWRTQCWEAERTQAEVSQTEDELKEAVAKSTILETKIDRQERKIRDHKKLKPETREERAEHRKTLDELEEKLAALEEEHEAAEEAGNRLTENLTTVREQIAREVRRNYAWVVAAGWALCGTILAALFFAKGLAPGGRKGLLTTQELILCGVILFTMAATTFLDANHSYLFSPADSAVMVIRQTTLLGIFSLGAAVVIIAGGIDLSAGSMIALSGTTCATLMVLMAPEAAQGNAPLSLLVIVAAILGTLIVGLMVGTLHAWLITSIRLPPFIATLATLVGLRSLARAICENVTQAKLGGKSTQIQIFDENFRYLATSVWIPLVIFVVLAGAIWFMLRCTVLGRHMYALGGNEQAARLSGIRTNNVKWASYCIGSLTATIAGILYIGDQSVADPQVLARGYELNAIAAAVVGGISLQGGLGTVPAVILGALFLRLVIDGVAKVIKTGADVFEGLIVGGVVVVAVAFTQFLETLRTRRRLFPGALGYCSIVTLSLAAGILGAIFIGNLGSYLSSLLGGAPFLDEHSAEIVGGAAGILALLGLGTIKWMELEPNR